MRLDALGAWLPESAKRTVKIRRAQLFERLGSERFAWPALYGLDRRLDGILGEGTGTFLEIGANDGYSQSNTWHLERHRGWTGILIEPLPSLYRICRKLRTRSEVFNFACVGPDGPPTLRIADRNLMSVSLGVMDADEEATRAAGARGVVEVPTTTLSDLIDRAGTGAVDFASIDVEGAELSVLAGLDLERHVPRWLLVETNRPDDVAQLLGGRMKLDQAMTHHDYLFRRA